MKSNCINCGAPIHNSKCDYCGTEYNLDAFGQINEYKIKLNIMGKEKEFYISNIEKHSIWLSGNRNLQGHLIHEKICDKLELKLIEM